MKRRERVAIVRLSAMGDIIHTSASLQFIKKENPNIEIIWFADSKFAPILEHNPYIDKLVPLDISSLKNKFSIKKFKEITAKIKNQRELDKIVDVQGLIKSAIVSKIAGKNIYGLDAKSAREKIATILYKHKFFVDCGDIAPLRFASLISKSLHIPISAEMMRKKEPCLFFDKSRDRKEIDSFFKKKDNIVIIVGASNISKTYPVDRWIETIKLIKDKNILLITGNEKEREDAKKIAQSTNAKLLPKMDLDNLKYAIFKSSLLIGGDTGPSHIAWAMNKPSILLFGSTPKSMMFETEKNVAICSNTKVHSCRFDKSDRSIATIQPKEIISKIEDLI